jgi:general secretion pathway protein H
MRTSAPGNRTAPTLAAGAAALPPEGARSPWGGPAANKAPTLAAGAAALPPEGARSPWGGPAANNPKRRLTTSRGFTLLELLVVIAIIAIASAGVSFALRETGGVQLEREAQRLAALLEAARAQSRMTGLPVRWQALEQGGFRFEGLAAEPQPQAWLHEDTQVRGTTTLLLGPEPIIGPQAVLLASPASPQRNLRVATDGLRPFSVSAETP